MMPAKKESTPYDKKEEYKDHIAPIVKQLRKECLEQNIPFFCTAAVTNTETDTTYTTEMVSAGTRDIELADDRIAKMVNVVNGYQVVLPQGAEELTEDLFDFF